MNVENFVRFSYNERKKKRNVYSSIALGRFCIYLYIFVENKNTNFPLPDMITPINHVWKLINFNLNRKFIEIKWKNVPCLTGWGKFVNRSTPLAPQMSLTCNSRARSHFQTSTTVFPRWKFHSILNQFRIPRLYLKHNINNFSFVLCKRILAERHVVSRYLDFETLWVASKFV